MPGHGGQAIITLPLGNCECPDSPAQNNKAALESLSALIDNAKL